MPIPGDATVTERLVAQIWKGQHLRGPLLTSTGQRIQVVYRGHENGEAGPDFRDALIALETGELLRGDVEVHVRSSHWRDHGHNRDANYNGVVLHVALWHDTSPLTKLESGKEVPTLSLLPHLAAPLEELKRVQLIPLWREPCRDALKRLGPSQVAALLESAGEERFQERARVLEGEVACKGPQQVLYQGLLETLGYAKNRVCFRELAERLPLRVLEGLSLGKLWARRVAILEALLLGMAGLLPSQRRRGAAGPGDGAPWVEELEMLWHSLGGGEAMRSDRWCFFRVRPENFPPRRLAGASRILATQMEEGLLEGLLRRVGEDGLALEEGLLVAAEGYWANHYDFGLPKARSSALIGRDRAREMVVNLLLPFAFAYGQGIGEERIASRAWELYRCHPPPGENRITREMWGRLGVTRPEALGTGALMQQGLIQIHKAFCIALRCRECSLSGQDGAGLQVQTQGVSSGAGTETEVGAGGDHGSVVGAEAGFGA